MGGDAVVNGQLEVPHHVLLHLVPDGVEGTLVGDAGFHQLLAKGDDGVLALPGVNLFLAAVAAGVTGAVA